MNPTTKSIARQLVWTVEHLEDAEGHLRNVLSQCDPQGGRAKRLELVLTHIANAEDVTEKLIAEDRERRIDL